MFRDELTLELEAGRGGDGLVSFRREAKVPRGGPDGGDGGRGGDIVFVARGEHNSLLKLGRARRYAAKNGRPGGTGNCTGRSASDLELDVPVGTQVFDAEHGNLLFDLAEPGAHLVIAAGGAGGFGNKHFANSVNQAPRRATPGRPGERRRVRLELKLMAQVGLVGLPNAGKSTFLARVTRATPKIADYPFTTLQPEVGIAAVGDLDTLVIADLPGLIQGAAEGHGLGDRFLRHVERCAVLLQFVDVSPLAAEPVEAFRTIDHELEQSSPALARKPRLVVGSKCETADDEARLEELGRALRADAPPGGAPRATLPLSSLTGRGVEQVLWAALREVRAAGAGPA